MNKELPDYDDLTVRLGSCGDGLSAAEGHGLLCGLLCSHPNMDREEWARRLLSGGWEAQAPIHVTASEEDWEIARTLYDVTVAQLEDPELNFALLLPDEDVVLLERSVALGEWCEGFLYGLSLGGVKDFSVFSEETREFAEDLVEISRLEQEADESEENESAMFDIIEYVRMGVIMMHDELAPLAANDVDLSPDDVILH